MDRAQFMKQLERLLSDISESERQEALAYYNGYFDDAGPENEASVIRELGSPGKVAAIIKADLDESNEQYARYTEHGYEDAREDTGVQVPSVKVDLRKQDHAQGKNTQGNTGETAGNYASTHVGNNQDGFQKKSSGRARSGYHPKEKGANSKLILVLIAVVFLSPFLAGAAGGILGILVTLLLLPFLIIFAAGALAFGLVVGAVACMATGVGLLASSVPVGVLVMGIGGILMAVGILCWLLVIWLASKILPWVLRKVIDFFQRILYRNKKEEQL